MSTFQQMTHLEFRDHNFYFHSPGIFQHIIFKLAFSFSSSRVLTACVDSKIIRD